MPKVILQYKFFMFCLNHYCFFFLQGLNLQLDAVFMGKIIASLLFPLKYVLAVLQGSSGFLVSSSLKDRATSQVVPALLYTALRQGFPSFLWFCFAFQQNCLLKKKNLIFLIIFANSYTERVSLGTDKEQLEN